MRITELQNVQESFYSKPLKFANKQQLKYKVNNLKFRWYPSIFLCLISYQVLADDLGPPAWRGSASSTYQRWDFNFQNRVSSKEDADCNCRSEQETLWGHYGRPEEVHNPYQEGGAFCAEFRSMWMISEKLDWINEHSGRFGIWTMQDDKSFPVFLNFKIPNTGPVVNRINEIHVQITYKSFYFPPGIKASYPSLKQSGVYESHEPLVTFHEPV